MTKLKTDKGFTLIELLVVVSIIGLLSSIILANISSARAKARDSARVQSLLQLRNALELYRTQYGSYPTTGGSWVTDYAGDSGFTNTLAPLVTNGYIPRVPDSNGPYAKWYSSPTAGNCPNTTNNPYTLVFLTETTINFPKWSDGNYYCITTN